MRVVSLGSGSSGNAVAIESNGRVVLVDAGFGPRALLSRLREASISPESVEAILLTHEHSDHACGARVFAARYGIPLVADPRTLAAVRRQTPAREADLTYSGDDLPAGRTRDIAGLSVTSFAISHDAVAPCGYLLASSAWRVCVVTDTGRVTDPMLDAMRAAHLLVLEANHDVQRLWAGPYPMHLKRRILSDTGHLSNVQIAEALEQALDDGPRWLWLAHLSRTNNTPDLAVASVREHLRQRMGIRHVVPHALPPQIGPTWDSAALLVSRHGLPIAPVVPVVPVVPDVGLDSPAAPRPADVAAVGAPAGRASGVPMADML